MAETAFQLQYRQEFIAGFETNSTLLRDTVTTEAMVKGNQATFLVATSGGATAVTRGVNGMIPARSDDVTPVTATLAEWHDLVRMTDFNIFASQGDRRALMQQKTMSVINRKIDSLIITELNTGTVNTGTAAPASMQLVTRSKTILGNARVPWDSNITGLITPAFEGYLLQIAEFSNADYVDGRPVQGVQTAWSDTPKIYRWLGINWIVHPDLPGAGTAAEKCFLYHKTAIGQVADTSSISTPIGYNEEQAYSFARASMNMGAKVLQNSGIVVMNHDGSAMVAG